MVNEGRLQRLLRKKTMENSYLMSKEELEKKIRSLQEDLQAYQDALKYHEEIGVFLDEFNIRTLSGLHFARKVLIRSGEYPNVKDEETNEKGTGFHVRLDPGAKSETAARSNESVKVPEPAPEAGKKPSEMEHEDTDHSDSAKDEAESGGSDTDSKILDSIEDMLRDEPEDKAEEPKVPESEKPDEKASEEEGSEEDTAMNWNFGDDSDTIAEEIVPDDKTGSKAEKPVENENPEFFFKDKPEDPAEGNAPSSAVSGDSDQEKAEAEAGPTEDSAKAATDLFEPDGFAHKIAEMHSGNDLVDTYKKKIAIARAEENISKTCSNAAWDLGITNAAELGTLYGGDKGEIDAVQSSKEAEALGKKMFETLSAVISDEDTPHAMKDFKAVKAFPDFIIFKAMYAFAADIAAM